MARRPRPKQPRDHEFQGKLYSLDDRCINCGYRLGVHRGGSIGECPKDGSLGPSTDHYTVRGTSFMLYPHVIMVPDGV